MLPRNVLRDMQAASDAWRGRIIRGTKNYREPKIEKKEIFHLQCGKDCYSVLQKPSVDLVSRRCQNRIEIYIDLKSIFEKLRAGLRIDRHSLSKKLADLWFQNDCRGAGYGEARCKAGCSPASHRCERWTIDYRSENIVPSQDMLLQGFLTDEPACSGKIPFLLHLFVRHDSSPQVGKGLRKFKQMSDSRNATRNPVCCQKIRRCFSRFRMFQDRGIIRAAYAS